MDLRPFGAIALLLSGCGHQSDESPTKPAISLAQAEEMRKSEERDNCKYNIESAMEQSLKPLLRDPDSYEKIDFVAVPLTDTPSGYGAILNYRSKNGFGGYTVAAAKVEYDADTCKITRIDSVQ